MFQVEIFTRDFGRRLFAFWPECGECFAPYPKISAENLKLFFPNFPRHFCTWQNSASTNAVLRLNTIPHTCKSHFPANLLLRSRICIIFVAEYANRFQHVPRIGFDCVPVQFLLPRAIVCKMTFSDSIFQIHFPDRLKPYLGRIYFSEHCSRLI